MTNEAELRQKDKFESWFMAYVVEADVVFPPFADGEYVEGDMYGERFYFTLQAMWMAWKAACAEGKE